MSAPGREFISTLSRPIARDIEALDLSEDMVRVASEYCRVNGLDHIHPRVGTAERLPFGDGEFDAVIALDLLHHVPDLERTLAEVDRVLKTGRLFFRIRAEYPEPADVSRPPDPARGAAGPAPQPAGLAETEPGRPVRDRSHGEAFRPW